MSEVPEVEETEILVRLTDAVEAGALAELLEAEGIAVATPGLHHRSMLGMVGAYVEIVVRVPRADLARAREILAAQHTSDGAASTAPDDDDAPRTDRLARIAVFAAVTLTFGSGHFYARRNRAGAILLALEGATIALAFAMPPFAYAILGIVVADVVGSTLSITADQRGVPPPTLARLAPLVAIAAILAVPAVRAFAPSVLAGRTLVAVCRSAAECHGEPADACIDRNAGRVFEGRSPSREQASDCAECLADSPTCGEAVLDCGVCAGLARLPQREAPSDRVERLRF